MLKRAAVLWLFSLLLLVGLHYVEMYAPKDMYGDMLAGIATAHSVIENLFRFITASLIFSLLRAVLLPHLAIDELCLSNGEWKSDPDIVRASAILVWGMIYVTVVYSFLMA